MRIEAAIAARVATGIPIVENLGTHSNTSCPECGGGLWEMVSDEVVRYPCYTGHVFTQNELLLRHTESLEATFWVALRMLEERKSLLSKMADEEERKGWRAGAVIKKERVAKLDVHIKRLKEILITSKQQDLTDVVSAA